MKHIREAKAYFRDLLIKFSVEHSMMSDDDEKIALKLKRMSTPEFDTVDQSVMRTTYVDFTDAFECIEKDAEHLKRDSPLNDLSKPATFNLQTFEPPEHPASQPTTSSRENHCS